MRGYKSMEAMSNNIGVLTQGPYIREDGHFLAGVMAA